MNWQDSQAADTATLDFADIAVGCNTGNGTIPDHETDLGTAGASSYVLGAADGDSMVESSWYFFYDVAVPTACASTDTHYTIKFQDAGASGPDHAADDVLIDHLVAYNDRIIIDGASDADFDADVDVDSAHEDETPLVAYLKEGGSTVATAYVDISSHDAAVTDASTALVMFTPLDGTDAVIEVSEGTSKTFTLELSSSNLLEEDAGSDDPVTWSMNTGTSSGGTVTGGDLWYNDTNFSSATAGEAPDTSFAMTTPGIIKWLGQVDSTTLNGNTLTY